MQLIDSIIHYAEENVEPIPLSIQLIIVLIICAICAAALLIRLFVNYKRNADEFETWSNYLRAVAHTVNANIKISIGNIKYRLHVLYYKIFKRTNKRCARCGNRVYKSDIDEYPYICFHCDENMFNIEVK